MFHARLKTEEGITVDNILCRAYLPKRGSDSVELNFYPNDEQHKALLPFWKFSMEGEVKRYDGEVVEKFVVNELHSFNSTSTIHGNGISEHLMTVQPFDFKNITFINGDTNLNKTIVSFRLTPNLLLEPLSHITNSYTGERTIRSKEKFEFTVDENVKFNFDRHYRYYRNDNGEDVSFSELVAVFETEDTADVTPIISDVQNKLDDVLLIASFAAMNNCDCVGWDSINSKEIVNQYFHKPRKPLISSSWSDREDQVVGLKYFKDFLKVAYTNFIEYPEKDALRRAISFVIPVDESLSESRFILTYAALEMLVLHFRHKNNIEFILKGNKFKKFRKSTEEFIEGSDFSKLISEINEGEVLEEVIDNKKILIKEKLSELNRISFKSAFEQFCQYYSIDLSDLWSVTDRNQGVTLSDIRNRLVHGEHFVQEDYQAMIPASKHLIWTVQRMILGVLGWSVENSNISAANLEKSYIYQDWREDQNSLSRKE